MFCNKHNLPELKTRTITDMFNHIEQKEGETLPPADMTCFAFDNLSHNAPLCDYLVHAYCYWAHDSLCKDFGSINWPSCLIARVLSRYSAFLYLNLRDLRCLGRQVCSQDGFSSPYDYHEHRSVDDRMACEFRQREEKQAM
ncbi:hypothetical protein CC86DRAFT_365321 [Ophiobolus disseminans]|uniref:Uncharacterized protein n=1 Tax=Ophiobolus disseminans TaxID=1469910 RepID=A0A6A7AL65_9PLEO|nr:hypothetical protein CC86DRAFT_365321 [Ophiobolus disseminans]